MLLFVCILALIWGVLWALFLHLCRYGQYLALRRTWLTVVVGVGMDLLIMLLVIPLEAWLCVCAVVACSSLGIIARALYIEHKDDEAVEKIYG